MFAPFTGEFGAAGAAELVLVGAACGAVGVWLLWFGRAFLAESLTHALLPALVVAATLGGGPVLGAVAGVLAAWALIGGLELAPKVSRSSANAGGVTALLGVGAILASGNDAVTGFEAILFGEPLGATTSDALLALAFAVLVGAALWLLHDRLKALVFDRDAAPGATPIVFAAFGLLVLSIAVSANLAGNLLAFALLVAPAAAAMSLARGVATALLLAAAIGALSGLLGILLSYHADLPASACIALVATAAVAAAQAVRSSRLLGAGRSL